MKVGHSIRFCPGCDVHLDRWQRICSDCRPDVVERPRPLLACAGCGKENEYRSKYGFCVFCEAKRQAVAYAHIKRATVTVRNAIVRGLLRPARTFPCMDCGAWATEYDHRNYNKPLEVEP